MALWRQRTLSASVGIWFPVISSPPKGCALKTKKCPLSSWARGRAVQPWLWGVCGGGRAPPWRWCGGEGMGSWVLYPRDCVLPCWEEDMARGPSYCPPNTLLSHRRLWRQLESWGWTGMPSGGGGGRGSCPDHTDLRELPMLPGELWVPSNLLLYQPPHPVRPWGSATGLWGIGSSLGSQQWNLMHTCEGSVSSPAES